MFLWDQSGIKLSGIQRHFEETERSTMAKSNDEHNVANVESINTSAAEIISPLSTDSTVTDRLNIRQSDRGHSSAVYIYKSLYPETYMFSYRSFNQYF